MTQPWRRLSTRQQDTTLEETIDTTTRYNPIGDYRHDHRTQPWRRLSTRPQDTTLKETIDTTT
ncbi:hypothetical protein DPMN_007699 [Dreissena polymorpha]|uniref:Uncharacterized protein n=1 Tax=Dreissena polymorpha TaxID=45954 RepID=A0A9D4MWB2_DREPO|nr:hypothetical protein DPMN_007699 [Dreissena polymorpha]